MLPGTRKRDHAAAGGGSGPALLGNHGLGRSSRPDRASHSAAGAGAGGYAAALLDALGLGSFARLDLPAPPDWLDLTAAVAQKPGSGSDGIIVSAGGVRIIASPKDLATALSLPVDVAALPAWLDAAAFSSVEAVAAVRAFVHDRLLLGAAAKFQMLPEETVAALQLVEEGRAYEVHWGWFAWAFVRSDVLIGMGRRCSRFLLHLMRCHRPDLFAEIDGRFLGKRRKGLILQQEDNLLHGNSGHDQLMAADAEVGERLSENIGELEKSRALVCVKDQQHTTGNDDSVGPALPSFHASRQQIIAHLSNMENAVSDRETTMTQTLAEIQHLKERAKEKDDQISYMVEEAKKTLQARATKLSQLEHDKMLMRHILDGYKNKLQESNAAFLEYRKMVCEGTDLSSSDAVADAKNHERFMQYQEAYDRINRIQKTFLLKVRDFADNIIEMCRKIRHIDNEVQRLKNSRTIPDLSSVVCGLICDFSI